MVRNKSLSISTSAHPLREFAVADQQGGVRPAEPARIAHFNPGVGNDVLHVYARLASDSHRTRAFDEFLAGRRCPRNVDVRIRVKAVRQNIPVVALSSASPAITSSSIMRLSCSAATVSFMLQPRGCNSTFSGNSSGMSGPHRYRESSSAKLATVQSASFSM